MSERRGEKRGGEGGVGEGVVSERRGGEREGAASMLVLAWSPNAATGIREACDSVA